MLVNLDGNFVPAQEAAHLLPGSPGFPGVFTTLRLQDGQAPDLDAHLHRLENHAHQLGLGACSEVSRIADIAADLARRNHLASSGARLRLTLAHPRPDKDPVLVVAVEPLPPGLQSDAQAGVAVLGLGPSYIRTHLPHLKTLEYSPSLQALAQADRAGCREALVFDVRGFLLEGAVSNVFVLMDGGWRTPPADGRILPGLTRSRLLEQLPPGSEGPVSRWDIEAAKEIFLSNSLRGIIPVIRVDDRMVGDGTPGPETRALQEGLKA